MENNKKKQILTPFKTKGLEPEKDFTDVNSGDDSGDKFDSKSVKDFTGKSELLPKKEIKLTKKQSDFVRHYVRTGGRGTEAYMTAYKVFSKGVASAAATRLLKTTAIQEALNEELLQLKSLEKIDRTYVIEKLKALAEKSEREENPKYLVESLDMLCKLAGFYQNNTQQPTTVQGNMNIMFGDFNPAGKILPPSNQPQNFNLLNSKKVENDDNNEIEDGFYENLDDDNLF